MQGISRRAPQEWSDIELARHLNDVLHVSFITPWNLGDVPEHWIEIIVRATNLYANMQQQGLIK